MKIIEVGKLGKFLYKVKCKWGKKSIKRTRKRVENYCDDDNNNTTTPLPPPPPPHK
jgi:hypothetical protein